MQLATLEAFREVKLPPLVHPQVLSEAAARCAELGGDKELLQSATIAAVLIQAEALRAHQGLAAAGILPPGQEPATFPEETSDSRFVEVLQHNPPAEPGNFEASELELSSQAKQAMAAAAATNQRQALKQPAPALPPPPPPPSSATVGLGQHHLQSQETANGQPLSMAAMFQNMPGVHQPMLQHHTLAIPAQSSVPMTPVSLPAPRDTSIQHVGKPQRPPAPPPVPVLHGAQDISGQSDSSPAIARPHANEDVQKEKPSPPGEDSEPIRCHLHRKPELNCKVCRRVYYSALVPLTLKKDDKGKDKAERKRHLEDEAPSVRSRGVEAFEVTNKQTFNFNSMLRDQILKNTYFKTLVNIDTFEGIVDEMYQHVESAETYGGGTTTVPSSLFCCLYRLFTIGISYDELNQLLDSKDWPCIRCCGFLYIRFGCAPERLWDFLGEYCIDDQEFEPSTATPGLMITIGEYVESLLMDERYYYSTLPRIPVGVKKKIEEKMAPYSQYRQRAAQNKRQLHAFREPGTLVEGCKENGTWVEGQTLQLNESIASRISVRVRLQDGNEELFHLGKVILRDDAARKEGSKRGTSHSRSRSPRGGRSHSPDLTRSRGKSMEEVLQELRSRQRERAVCSTGKEYAKKPIGFMSGLALKRDMGLQATRLREEETYAPKQVEHRKQMTELR